MTYSESILNLSNSLLQSFDEVFHSVQIIQNDKGEKLPAYPLEDEYLDVVFSDTKETVYIRRNGDDEAIEDLKIGSCVKSYKMRTPVRIVYSKDFATDHNTILFKLMQSVLIGGTKLKGIVRDKFKLQKEESTARLRLGASSAYFAVDVYVFWQLLPDNCEQEICKTLENPLRKCPVVA
jgi:CRISPR/Cas system CMR subunit Cmr6 (Cas7 group RAMP superfamily)